LSPYLRAIAALAQGRVCLATGDGDTQACLREALNGFARAQVPMELARARLELSQALVADRPDVAPAEARAVLDVFERLQAARQVDAVAAVLRSLGVRTGSPTKTTGQLTKREAEVLDLLGHGLSNPQIAERLYISRKTVEHHVGNILAKLAIRGLVPRGWGAWRGPMQCRSYEFTTQLATLQPPAAEVQQLLGAIQGNPDAMSAFVSVIAGTLSPVEFFDSTYVQQLLAGAGAGTAASPS
jgi:DNA-binding NarL/FixJ family response regulator